MTVPEKLRPLPTYKLVEILERIRKEQWAKPQAQVEFIQVLEQEISRRRREAS